MDTLPRRNQGTACLAASRLVVEHQVAYSALRLGMAMEFGIELLRILELAHFPGIDDGIARLHLDLVFELAVIAADRNIDHVCSESFRVGSRQRFLAGRGRNLVPFHRLGCCGTDTEDNGSRDG